MAVSNIPRPATRGRRRSPGTAHAILKATRELLADEGVHGLTIEGVAARSGVAKTTIYRRWRSKEDLALAALLEAIEKQKLPARNLGSTRAELTAYVEGLIKNLNTGLYGRIIRGLASDIATDNELARGYRERVLVRRAHEVNGILQRGIERGDVPPGDRELAVELLFGPIYYRLLLEGKPLTKAFARRLVNAFMAYVAI